MIRFFVNNLTGDEAILTEEEYHHCIKVLRHRVGDDISVTDGKGTTAKAKITQMSKSEAHLLLSDKDLSPPTHKAIHLHVAPPKNRSRWEWLVEKSCELGVSSLTALVTERTERARINEERTHKIMRSAALQCLRPYHPEYKGSAPLNEVLLSSTEVQDRYLAHYRESNPALASLKPNHQECTILIGPEGDFSKAEISQCLDTGYHCVNLSHNRLRTETAAITVVHTLKLMGY